MNRMTTGLTLVLLIGLVAGCGNKQPQVTAPPPPLSDFDRAKEPPINAKTRFAVGQLAESRGKLNDAIRQYDMALKIDPNYQDAVYRKAVIYTESKSFNKALENWNKYLKMTHESASAYSNLGFCQELAGDPGAAEAAYRKGIARDPENAPCHVNYGLMLARHNRPNEGLLQLQTVLTPAEAHYDIASVYQTLGKKPEAQAEFAKALDLDPSFDEAKSRLATLELNKN
jgi:tetratricopeptide (TPR) repeat protein